LKTKKGEVMMQEFNWETRFTNLERNAILLLKKANSVEQVLIICCLFFKLDDFKKNAIGGLIRSSVDANNATWIEILLDNLFELLVFIEKEFLLMSKEIQINSKNGSDSEFNSLLRRYHDSEDTIFGKILESAKKPKAFFSLCCFFTKLEKDSNHFAKQTLIRKLISRCLLSDCLHLENLLNCIIEIVKYIEEESLNYSDKSGSKEKVLATKRVFESEKMARINEKKYQILTIVYDFFDAKHLTTTNPKPREQLIAIEVPHLPVIETESKKPYKKRGRPRKIKSPEEIKQEGEKIIRKRGRPRKIKSPVLEVPMGTTA
jgi:hypothetical protein